MRQQSEPFDDDGRLAREAENVFDDQIEALTPKPVERLEHRLRQSFKPPLVHVHDHELMQQRTVFGRAAASVIRHHVVSGVDTQAVLICQATRNSGLAGAAPAADPVDVLELFLKRGQASLLLETNTR